jgi:hypothetical protein
LNCYSFKVYMKVCRCYVCWVMSGTENRGICSKNSFISLIWFYQTLYGSHFRNIGAPFMWKLKKKYDYWWKKYGLEKTDRATKTSLFDRNWTTIPNSLIASFLRLQCSTFVFVKGRGTCGSGKRNVKIWINFRKSPRFSLTSPLC